MPRLVGIDLGTTNTVVASLEGGAIEVFRIDQLVDEARAEPRPLLPSTLYAPLASERDTAFSHPLAEPPFVVGEHARRRGAEVPGRAIASAKSWLCHGAVDRLAAILPWGAEEDEADPVPRISPVDASARILRHVRGAWDRAFPNEPLAEQEIVLTVPASFDEAARELTIEATRRAGLSVTLLEEPTAAFHDFARKAGDAAIGALLGDRERLDVLVCDVGGGTTDLSSLRVTRSASGELRIDRVAVGDHLLLGGDNMDLALAHLAESKLVAKGGAKLAPSRFAQLVAACRDAKEKLLGENAAEEITVTVLGEGSRLVGGALKVALRRDEVEAIVLDGFFPRVARDAKPDRARAGLVSFGLPYARDTAITRHVAVFLARNGLPPPDALLLNGGVFHAERAGERLAEVVGSWRGEAPRILPHVDPDLAVARGAVAFGLARRGEGRRIGGGSPHAYFVGVGSAEGERAICVVPRGAEPGTRHRADVALALVVGRAARFDLFASRGRDDHRPGDIVAIDPEEHHRLPPIATTLKDDGGRGATEVKVALEGELGEVGTLDLALVEQGVPDESARRFSLAFQLRAATEPPPASASRPPPAREHAGSRMRDAIALVHKVFGRSKEAASPREVKDLVRDLERVLGERSTWTAEDSRALFDVVASEPRARRRSPDHERVFWSLAGYTLRPGFGFPEDERRIAQVAPLFGEGVQATRDPRVFQQFWIAWRRVAGGLDEPMQTSMRDAVDVHLLPTEGKKKKPRVEAQDDLLAMAAWLERVPPARRAELGNAVLERTWTDRDARLREALGRIGARVPSYASAHYVVPPRVASEWLDHLLRERWNEIPAAAAAAARIARRTDDRARDVPERMRSEVAKRLDALGEADLAHTVREVVTATQSNATERWGESLPVGLRLVD